MAEYIEREAIEYPYMTMSMWGINSATCKAYNEGVKAVEDYIASIPTADVVEVVRCKDCKFCDLCYPKKDIGKDAVIGFYCRLRKHCVDPTAFCSYGVRKEGAEE